MDINIKPLLSSEERKVTFSYGIPISYSENGYTVSEPIEVCGEVKDMGGYMVLDAKASVKYVTECARCLKELNGECEIQFVRTVATSLESEDGEDEYIIVGENSCLSIDDALTEEIILSLPTRSLCSDDCKGLCPKCGCNKNVTECGCVLSAPDPRWNALKAFSEKGK